VGTVLGYRYPHLLPPGQTLLPFTREDAPDSRANLAKLGAGRVRYAIVDALALREQQRRQPQQGLRLELVLSRYTAQCALGPQAGLTLAEVNQALDALQRDGRLPRLLARYTE
jgi:ABC-type amino acid transport substrate-binding protein